ncbi:hypothetical protein C8J56DRAFT_547054 [Mycena floridula]|nr:hypothetical protein C8J56DRAFT_547054 [Mycena floridula]
MQTAWYQTVAKPFGVPLDTRHTYTKADWSIWTAACQTTTVGRDLFISSVKKYLAGGQSSQPFGDWYETLDGKPEAFRARSVVGATAALLILPTSQQFTSSNTSTNSSIPDDLQNSAAKVSISPLVLLISCLLSMSFLEALA